MIWDAVKLVDGVVELSGVPVEVTPEQYRQLERARLLNDLNLFVRILKGK